MPPDPIANPLPPFSEAEVPVEPTDPQRGSRLISRLLPPAIRLWLQTQLDHIEGLEFRVEGRDRQILSGFIPQVHLSAQRAVYQGLHVSRAAVQANDIYLNLGQVVRGKPLRLLQPFPVEGQVYLALEDVRASLQAPLLTQGLQDLFQQLLGAQNQTGAIAAPGLPPTAQLTDLALGDGLLALTWQLSDQPDERLKLQTNLTIREGRWLCLCPTTVMFYQAQAWSAPTALEDVVIDLGPEANIQRLAVTATAIELMGIVRVIPGS